MSKNKWIKTFNPSASASLRLICFPYAGGSAQVFKDWQQQLPPFVEVSAIQYPGRGSRFSEPSITDLTEMVDKIENNLIPFLNRPFAFFGHSMGAGIAFELTRKLQKRGLRPRYLFVSGRNAPHVRIDKDDVHTLPDDEFREKLKSMNGTPHEVLEHPELMELMLPLLRADFTLSETADFDLETELGCPMVAFGGEKDEDVSAESIEGWGRYSGTFQWHMLAGDHFFLAPEQQMDELLRELSRYLSN